MHAHTNVRCDWNLTEGCTAEYSVSSHWSLFLSSANAAAVINFDFIWTFSLSICSHKSSNICSESLKTEKHWHFCNVQYVTEFITFGMFMALTFEPTRKGEGLIKYNKRVCNKKRIKPFSDLFNFFMWGHSRLLSYYCIKKILAHGHICICIYLCRLFTF